MNEAPYSVQKTLCCNTIIMPMCDCHLFKKTVENVRRRKRNAGESDELTEDELLAARLEAERIAAEQAEADRLEREGVSSV